MVDQTAVAGGMVMAAGGLGAWLVLVSLTDRRTGQLARRLRRLSAQERYRQEEEERRRTASAPLFRSPLLQALIGRPLEELSWGLADAMAGAGLLPGDLQQRLDLALPGYTVGRFLAEKVLLAVVAGAVYLVLTAGGMLPFPPALFPLPAALAYFYPDRRLAARLRERARQVKGALPVALDIVALALSGGQSPEQALQWPATCLEGPLAEALRHVLREVAVGRRTYAQALREVAAREQVATLEQLADLMEQAEESGIGMGDRVLVLAAQERERWRVELMEQASKASVAMLMPLAGLILPALLLVLLFPAGRQILVAF